MQKSLKSSSSQGVLAGVCMFAVSTGLDLAMASPQVTHAHGANTHGATVSSPMTAVSATPRKSSPEKIKQPVTAAGCKSVLHPGKPYFVEFRSRGAVSYGHTFIFFGRLGGSNKYASFKVAGLHPKGDDASTYMLGHMVPVEAETGASYGDLDEQYLTARFCVTLSEAEYKKAAEYIGVLQATKKTWHAPTYNCNSFAADIAKFIGLDTPNPNMYLPDVFVTNLGKYNSKAKDAATVMLPNVQSPKH